MITEHKPEQDVHQYYQFSQDWFSHNIPSLNAIFEHIIQPQRILEIGSFEGLSTAYFLEKAIQYHDEIEIFCIDSWLGGQEHTGRFDMSAVEERFEHNMAGLLKFIGDQKQVNVVKLKGYSHQQMIDLLAKGYQNYFDFIYVDGSHEAPDVLFDALLAHRLVKVGGVIVFDDYLWSPSEEKEDDHYLLVKPAVDHYVNTYQRKLKVLQNLHQFQLYVKKLAD